VPVQAVYTDLPPGYGPDSAIAHGGMDPVWRQLTAILVARYRVGPLPSGPSHSVPEPTAPGVRRVPGDSAVKAVESLAAEGLHRAVHGRGGFVLSRNGGGDADR